MESYPMCKYPSNQQQFEGNTIRCFEHLKTLLAIASRCLLDKLPRHIFLQTPRNGWRESCVQHFGVHAFHKMLWNQNTCRKLNASLIMASQFSHLNDRLSFRIGTAPYLNKKSNFDSKPNYILHKNKKNQTFHYNN